MGYCRTFPQANIGVVEMRSNRRYICYAFVVFSATLTGCAYNLQLMPRDGGKVYAGKVASNGMGAGTVSVDIDGKSCNGPFVTTDSGSTFGFAQTYGNAGNQAFQASGFSTMITGAGQYKALLTCSDGTGLRCDVRGQTQGAGICVDSNSKVYDLIYQ